MASVVDYFSRVFLFSILFLPFAACIRYWRFYRLKKRGIKTSFRHEAGTVLFWLVSLSILSQTILSEIGTPGWLSLPDEASDINLELFRVFDMTFQAMQYGRTDLFWINFLGNILIFIPVGFLLPLLWRISCPRAVGICFLFSLGIEVVQLFLPRTTDVDDLWLNTLGGLFGVLLFCLFRRLSKNTEKYRIFTE